MPSRIGNALPPPPRRDRPLPDMLRRQRATGNTLEKFRRKEFDWRRGITCAHLMRFHLKAMGHAVPPMPAFKSPNGAKAALAGLGFDSMGGFLAARCQQVAPAAMLLGDLATLPGEHGLDGVWLCCSEHALFGWMEDQPKPVIYDLGEAWNNTIPDEEGAGDLAGQRLADVVRVFRL